MIKTIYGINMKVFRNSLIILIIFFLPINYIHEIGHAIACASEGKQFEITVTLFGSYLVCHGTVNNEMLFLSIGGLFAMSVSLIPIMLWKYTKNHKSIIITSLSFSIGQGLNAMIETLAKDYNGGNSFWTIYINMVNFAVFVIILFVINKDKKQLQLGDIK